jgi:hypothetical protein
MKDILPPGLGGLKPQRREGIKKEGPPDNPFEIFPGDQQKEVTLAIKKGIEDLAPSIPAEEVDPYQVHDRVYDVIYPLADQYPDYGVSDTEPRNIAHAYLMHLKGIEPVDSIEAQTVQHIVAFEDKKQEQDEQPFITLSDDREAKALAVMLKQREIDFQSFRMQDTGETAFFVDPGDEPKAQSVIDFLGMTEGKKQEQDGDDDIGLGVRKDQDDPTKVHIDQGTGARPNDIDWSSTSQSVDDLASAVKGLGAQTFVLDPSAFLSDEQEDAVRAALIAAGLTEAEFEAKKHEQEPDEFDFPEIDVLAQDMKDMGLSKEDAYGTLMNRYGDRAEGQIEKILDELWGPDDFEAKKTEASDEDVFEFFQNMLSGPNPTEDELEDLRGQAQVEFPDITYDQMNRELEHALQYLRDLPESKKQEAVDLYCPNCGENLGKDVENPNPAYCPTCGEKDIPNERGYDPNEEGKQQELHGEPEPGAEVLIIPMDEVEAAEEILTAANMSFKTHNEWQGQPEAAGIELIGGSADQAEMELGGLVSVLDVVSQEATEGQAGPQAAPFAASLLASGKSEPEVRRQLQMLGIDEADIDKVMADAKQQAGTEAKKKEQDIRSGELVDVTLGGRALGTGTFVGSSDTGLTITLDSGEMLTIQAQTPEAKLHEFQTARGKVLMNQIVQIEVTSGIETLEPNELVNIESG